jgi:LytS/YehU family sensor histidine kinase
VESEPARAEEVLAHLAALFQYALRAGERQTLPLEEELAAVRDYLTVEGVRFGDRLTWSVEAAPEALAHALPPLSVQLLVENAVVHGVSPRRGPGRVTVHAEVVGDRLRVIVEDDGVGLGGGSRPGNGFGLPSLRERLRLQYGEAATLDLAEGRAGGVRVVLEVP